MSKEDLCAMGFDPAQIDKAIASTDGSIEQCIDWIERAQNGEPMEAEAGAGAAPSGATEASQAPTGTVAERLAELKVAAAKRKAEEEKQLRKERIEIQKRSVEADRARDDLKVAAAKKAAADRKREATEDRLYREELRRKIEQDKLEREVKAREAKREREGASASAAPRAAPAAAPAKPTGQIRMRVRHGAKTLVKTAQSTQTVEDLGEELATELGLAPGSFHLESAYPKEEIVIVGNSTTLGDAGLANASLSVVL